MADVVVTIGGNSKELKKLLRSEIRAMRRLENTKKRQERQGVSRRRRTRREEARERVQTERSVNRRTSRESRRGRGRSNRIGRFDRAVRRGGRAFAGGTGILTSLTSEIKGVLEYGRALSQMSVQAGISVERQMEIEEQINKTSIATGASRDDIVSGMAAIVDKSGDLEFAVEALDQMAKSGQGSGAAIQDLGFMFTALKTSLNLTSKEALKFGDILTAQGDIGSFTLKDFSKSGEGLFGAAASVGVRDLESFIQFGALTQTAGKTATSSEAATAVRNLSNELLGRAGKIKKISGVDVFRPGTKQLKPLVDLMKEIITATGADITKLITRPGEAEKTIGFRIRAVKPLKNLAAAFEAGRGFTDVDKFITAGRREAIAKKGRGEFKFEEVEKRSAALAFDKLGAVLTVAGDKALAPLLVEMAKALTTIIQDEDKLKRFIQQFRDVGKTLADVFEMMSKAGPFLNTVARIFGIETSKDADFLNRKGEVINLNVKNEMTIDPVTGNTKSEKTTVTKQNNSDLGTTTFTPSAGR